MTRNALNQGQFAKSDADDRQTLTPFLTISLIDVQASVNPYFEALLETGVDEMTWDDVGDDNVSLCLQRATLSGLRGSLSFFRIPQRVLVTRHHRPQILTLR